MPEGENGLNELEALKNIVPFAPFATSYEMGWKGLQAARNKAPPGADALLTYLEPRLVARIATEAFAFDPTRTLVPPLDGLNSPQIRSAMLAVDAELSSGGVGGPLLIESLANILSVRLIRHITGRTGYQPRVTAYFRAGGSTT